MARSDAEAVRAADAAVRRWLEAKQRDRLILWARNLVDAGISEPAVASIAANRGAVSDLTVRRQTEALLAWLGSLPAGGPDIEILAAVPLEGDRDASLLGRFPAGHGGPHRIEAPMVAFDPSMVAQLTEGVDPAANWATIVVRSTFGDGPGGRWRRVATFSTGVARSSAPWDHGGDLAAILNALDRCGWEPTATEVIERGMSGGFGAEQSYALATQIVARRKQSR